MVIQILGIIFKKQVLFPLFTVGRYLAVTRKSMFLGHNSMTCKYILSTFSCLLFKCSLASVLLGLCLLSFGDGFNVASFLSLPLTKSVFTV